MEFLDAKKLISYARKQGLKHLRCGDLDVTFQDGLVTQTRQYRRTAQQVTAPGPSQDPPRPEPRAEPTLEQIYNHIYSTDETA